MNLDLKFCQVAMDAYSRAPDILGYGIDQNIQVVVEDVNGLIVVGARGSKVEKDWMMDFLAVPVLDHQTLSTERFGPVHAGFLAAAMSVQQQVFDTVAGRRYALTGHSLGGAIALLLGAILQTLGSPPDSVVTFGAPRVGMDRFVDAVAPLRIREYVNGNDPVPSAPIFMLHGRTPIRIGASSLDVASRHYLSNYFLALGGSLPAQPKGD